MEVVEQLLEVNVILQQQPIIANDAQYITTVYA